MSRNARRCIVALALVLATPGFAQNNVVQPSDPIIASSSNNPGSEGVGNAIDGTQAKYLNFDLDNDRVGGPIPAGFVVTPSVGATRVTAVRILSANDAPDRDPKVFTLEGSNDASITSFSGGNWEPIATVQDITPWPTVFPGGGAADRYKNQTFTFPNLKAYTSYRWTVQQTHGPSTCCMQVAEVSLLGSTIPSDVTQPSDAIVASSSNSPGSEGGRNAIDNTQAKYLNFDLDNDRVGGPLPAGLIVTPSVGDTVLTGLRIKSANDAPDRDPKTMILEGSNDATVGAFNTGNWTFIAGMTNITPWPTVFPGGGAADRYKDQTFLFDNVTPYKHYRWTVLTTQGPSTCCMQIAEVDFLGTAAPKDVTQPSDPLIASSSNSPGSEGGRNAIDNTQAKYLNFDLDNDRVGGPLPAGFVVTPSIGAVAVTGITILSANDAPDRDPKTMILEGSNDDTISAFNSGNWTFVAGVTNITPWPTLYPGGGAADRYKTQSFYFANNTAYKHYRWTVLATQGPSTCCMQVAEVDLLAVTASNPCGQTAFTVTPENTPALAGSTATFFAKVNGPWTVQWLSNSVPIPGATQLQYTTPPVDATIAAVDYSLAIVGCQTSQVVRASIFSPSTVKSIGLSFVGGGANGAPTTMNEDDIAGVQPQAYWNNLTGGTGFTGDGTRPDVLKDSDNADSTITVDYATSGTWGAGTGSDSATQRMLNGLVHTPNSPGTPARITFGNVPAGNHAVLVYLVGIPGQNQSGDYWVNGATSQTNYVRVMNADQYKPSPGFYSGVSADPNVRPLANFVRFDGIAADASGNIEIGWDTATQGGGDRGVPVNAVQLVLNAPNPGPLPVITAEPQPTVAPTNGTVRLTVTATGSGLTYQWRRNGVALSNGGDVSGATSPTLTLSNFTSDDAGTYSVAVFSPAGSVISKNAVVNVSSYNINSGLAAYLKFDETSGTTAANSVAGAPSGVITGTGTFGAGLVGNALTLDGASYVTVTNYAKATKQISANALVNIPAGVAAADIVLVQNAEPTLRNAGDGANRKAGQFSLRLLFDGNTQELRPSASIGIGPNIATATSPTPISTDAWHQIAFSADGAQLRLYVDGVEVARTEYLSDITSADIPYLTIGAALSTDLTDPDNPVFGPDGTNPAFLTGAIDEVAVWTRAITADEVRLLNEAEKAGRALSTVQQTPPTNTTPTLTGITRNGTAITINFANGRLEASPAVAGTGVNWQVVSTTSPYTEQATANTKFFRVVNP